MQDLDDYVTKTIKNVQLELNPDVKYKFILIEVPVDFNPLSLDGNNFDPKTKSEQQLEEVTYIKQISTQFNEYAKDQMALIIPQKNSSKMSKGRKISKVFKIYNKYEVPPISKKHIIKTKPIHN